MPTIVYKIATRGLNSQNVGIYMLKKSKLYINTQDLLFMAFKISCTALCSCTALSSHSWLVLLFVLVLVKDP